MLGHYLAGTRNALTLKLYQSIVIRYQKQKSIFDTTSYNPQWIPRQIPYHKLRKPRMAIWSDPQKKVPFLIPPMRRKEDPRQYIKKVIEQEEKQKSMRKKLYLIQIIRPGDIVDITYQETYQSEATVTHRGLVLSYKRKNSLTAGIQMMVRLGGMNIKGLYLIHSPKIKNIKIVSRGSGTFKANIKFGWRKLGKNSTSKPKIRNNVMRNRDGVKRKKRSAKISSMKYDKVKSDNVKRIINL